MSLTRLLKRRVRLDSSLAPFALFAAVIGCGGIQAPASAGGSALVAIHGAGSTSGVRVDRVERGTIERTGGAYLVAAGERRIEVDTPGHFPVWLDLRLRAGETYDVTVQLWPCFPDIDDRCHEAMPSLLELAPLSEE